MKHAIEKQAMAIGMKMAAGAGLALALGGLASAQLGSDGRRGQELVRGSLENDLRPGLLNLRVMLRDQGEFDPAALIPLADDFDKLVILSGGAVRAGAAIELVRLDVRGHGIASGAVIRGFFGANGEFVVELPKELDVRGLGVRGAQFSGRFVTEVVDLEEAVAEAYATWETLGEVAAPQGAAPGGMHELQRPSRGSGSAARAPAPTRTVSQEVELGEEPIDTNEISFEELNEIAKPQGASPGGMRELHQPSRGAGSAAQAPAPGRSVTRTVDVSDDDQAEAGISFEKLGDVARPQAAGGAGGKVELRRPVRRDGHIGR